MNGPSRAPSSPQSAPQGSDAPMDRRGAERAADARLWPHAIRAFGPWLIVSLTLADAVVGKMEKNARRQYEQNDNGAFIRVDDGEAKQ